MNKKIIGIDIDGVIRAFIDRFAYIYEKEMGIKPLLPVTNENLIEHFPFPNGEKELESFIYDEFVLEIFAHAKEIRPNTMFYVNQLADKIKNMGHELILISKQFGKSKSATLFFLSKIACQVDKIIFVQNSSDKWKHVDIMVDDSSSVLNSKPENKISIKFETAYNKDVKSNYVIDDIKILLDDEKFLEEIINYEFIEYQEVNYPLKDK